MSQGQTFERREHPRIHLRAYAFDQAVELLRNVGAFHLGMVDISAGGARLRHMEQDLQGLFGVGEICTCNFPGISDVRLQGLKCEVRWTEARQMGVRFLPVLDLSTVELQRLFTR